MKESDILEAVPPSLIEVSVHEWVEENKQQIADFIINRIGKFAAEWTKDPYKMELKLLFVRQEEMRQELINISYHATGLCPECGQHVKGYKSPSGSFAPEAYATMREMGLDPSTGHKANCSRRHERVK